MQMENCGDFLQAFVNELAMADEKERRIKLTFLWWDYSTE